MLGVIVPVKEKSKSKNWDKDNELLRNTLYSICNQTSNSYKVFVVYTDMPFFLKNDKVIYVKYPFPFLLVKDISDYESFLKKHFSDSMGQGVFDKGKRVMYGSKFAKEHGCNYVMSLDSDDLVTNKLAAFIDNNQTEKFGWYVNKGYILLGKQRLLIKVRANMNHLNGSTNIANINLIPKIDFETKSLYDVSFFINHAFLKDRIFNEYKETLKPLPFYTIIYLIHDNNWSGYKTILKKDLIKTLIKYIVRGKWFGKKIENEFGLYK